MLLATGYPNGISGTDLQSSSANASSFTSLGPAGSRGSVAVSLSCVVSSVSSACAGSPATSPAPWAHSAQRSLQLSQAYCPKRPAVASPRYPIGRCAYLLQSCSESINPSSSSSNPSSCPTLPLPHCGSGICHAPCRSQHLSRVQQVQQKRWWGSFLFVVSLISRPSDAHCVETSLAYRGSPLAT